MRSLRSIAALTALLAIPSTAAALDLPFKKSKLDNGLTVIVHEDHTLPTVAVNLVYRVGSRDEEVKRTGFAHLFEHLMFMGTRRAPPKRFDEWMEAAGGANNAWTSEDLTDYHEHGPPGALGLLLWLEADRLEGLGREIDKAKLDLQRDVVRNERRQSYENVPYAKVELRMPELLWPESHPYHHTVIGSHEDLEAASVEDVRRFFDKYYVPSNAALVVAGDVKPGEVDAAVKQLFGSIPAGTRPVRAEAKMPPRLGKVVRETMEDRVELAKIVMTFHAPARFAPGDAELDLFAAVLATGKSSRLYKTLVYDKPLAQSVSAAQSSNDLVSTFTIEVVARPGVSLDDLEKAIDAVLADAVSRPPADDEMRRAKSRYEHAFVSRLQSIEARAQLLAMYEVATGDPGFVDKDLGRYRAATAATVFDWAKKTVTLGERVVVRVVPKDASKGGAP
jgi:zinc protease